MVSGALKQRLRHTLPISIYEGIERLAHLRPAHRRYLQHRAKVASDRRHLDDQVIEAVGSTRVQSGPWRGMHLSRESTWGLDFSARLLGTYEMELHETFESILAQGLKHVVDVGCADGYYVVGLALRAKGAHIVGYDIDPRASAITIELATTNGVADRVKVRGRCNARDLIGLPKKSLVLMDCEGAENALLTPDVVESNPGSAFIIECHDSIVDGTTDRLRDRFLRAGRDVTLAYPSPRSAPPLNGVDSAIILAAIDELRDQRNPWLIA
jgi:SAM-dependent methyltransferase